MLKAFPQRKHNSFSFLASPCHAAEVFADLRPLTLQKASTSCVAGLPVCRPVLLQLKGIHACSLETVASVHIHTFTQTVSGFQWPRIYVSTPGSELIICKCYKWASLNRSVCRTVLVVNRLLFKMFLVLALAIKIVTFLEFSFFFSDTSGRLVTEKGNEMLILTSVGVVIVLL